MMRVVATAGHVDHGKSTLVRALTGMEPDRWAEEHRRGLTIDLGFAWTSLPSGESLAFVDVPGHERFVTNMLAGVGPAPAVLFVVAADEGWMPQSAEHLDALAGLGVRHGVLAVTRSDLADPAPARSRALRELAATSLGQVEAHAVSGTTGAGLPELRSALDHLVAGLPEPEADDPVRLWVDRTFTVRGAGTVVTGTLAAGTLRTGDELEIAPTGRRARVRGLQTLKRHSDSVSGVARVAINLRGIEVHELRRGMALLTPHAWLSADVVDVRLHHRAAGEGEVGSAEQGNRVPGDVTLHVGAAAVPARVRPLGADVARVTLSGALPMRIGDVGLLRDPGRRAIVAGVTVLDVRPPMFFRRGAAASRGRDLADVPDIPDGAVELARRGWLRREDLLAMGCAVPATAVVAGDWLADPEHWARLRHWLAEAVREYGSAHPLDPRMPADAARHVLGLPGLRMLGVLAAEAGEDGVRFRDGCLSVGDPAPTLPVHVREALSRLRSELETAPFAAPEAGRLAELGLDGELLTAAVRAGALVRVSSGICLLPDAPERAVEILGGLEQPFTVSQARTALETTRRVAVPLLEHLDTRGLTVRVDNTHRTVQRTRG